MRDRAAGADRHRDHDQVGIPDGFRAGFGDLVGKARADLAHALSGFGEASVTTTVFAAPVALAARATEPPIRPAPITARREMMGAVVIMTVARVPDAAQRDSGAPQ